jgi:SHS2 domain-containing protein
MPFKFIEDIAIADIAFEVTAPTLSRLFEDAGMAASDIMVDPKNIKPKMKKTIKLSADSLENLMYDFLSELVYLKDTKGMLFGKYSVKVDEKKNSLVVVASGEKIDRKRHSLRNDLKAITMHMFVIERREKGWYTRVVVDI